jgi:hypothetical protein
MFFIVVSHRHGFSFINFDTVFDDLRSRVIRTILLHRAVCESLPQLIFIHNQLNKHFDGRLLCSKQFIKCFGLWYSARKTIEDNAADIST